MFNIGYEPRMEDLKVNLKKLDGSNFDSWKFRMELVLKKENVWDVVSEVPPEVKPENWESKNSKAMAIIGLTVDDSQLSFLRKATSAHESWSNLVNFYEKGSLFSKVILLKKLCKITFDESLSMQQHIINVVSLIDRLNAMGENIAGNMSVAFLLSSLPESYDTVVMSLETRKEEDLTFEIVKTRLLEEYERRKEKCNTKSNEAAFKCPSTSKNFRSKKFGNIGNSSKIRCFHCHKEGHVRSACPELKQNVNKQKINKLTENDEVEEVLFMTDKGSPYSWYVDSAATSHITSNYNFFLNIDANVKTKVFLANGQVVQSLGKGSGYLYCDNGNGGVTKVLVTNVLYIPEIEGNLISVKKLVQMGLEVNFEGENCFIMKNSNVMAVANFDGLLYKLSVTERVSKINEKLEVSDIETWHCRFGHRNVEAIRKLVKNNLVDDIGMVSNSRLEKCETCVLGKSVRKPFFGLNAIRSKSPLELVHTDLCGPMKNQTPSGKKYFLTFVDDYSRYCVIFLLREKSEVFEKFVEYTAMVENQFGKKLKIIRSDNGGEYTSEKFSEYCKKNGIVHEFTIPYTPQQNGVAERKNRTIQEMANCLLIHANFQKTFWGEAVMTANFLQNRLPTSLIEKTPYELWNNKKPKLNFLKTFGCKALVHIPNEKRSKFDNRSKVYYFVGYSQNSKGYRLVDLESKKVVVSRDVNFFENIFPLTNIDENNLEDLITNETDKVDDYIELNLSESNVNNQDQDQNQIIVHGVKNELDQSNVDESIDNEVDIANLKFDFESDPVTYDEALLSVDRRKWLSAMDEEMREMEKHKVWDLVDSPIGKNIIKCKWVFKTKLDPLNKSKIFRARLVAKGCNQHYGVDYDQIFAPVVKSTSFRILLTICGNRKIPIRHFDVKVAFLNGDLKNEIYMYQPDGFNQDNDLVCKLNKSVYGLKQAARAWNDKFNDFLIDLNFVRSDFDPGIYIKQDEKTTVYILLYVDDFLLATDCIEELDMITTELKNHFEIKDLGNISFYLGIEVSRSTQGIFSIRQSHYINRLIDKFNLIDAKDSNLPIEPNFLKNEEDNNKFENKTLYQQAIGSLLYISLNSRPDIAFSVGLMGRSASDPSNADWREVKRILKYLKSTCKLELKFEMGNENIIKVYSDADWGGDPKTRKSTSGNVVFMGNSLIDWFSKKQSSVALSSTEAELIALSESCKNIKWIRGILNDLGLLGFKILLFEDNQSVIEIILNDAISRLRTKHIDIRHRFVKDYVVSGEANIEYCPTSEMLADGMTKILTLPKIKKFRIDLNIN